MGSAFESLARANAAAQRKIVLDHELVVGLDLDEHGKRLFDKVWKKIGPNFCAAAKIGNKYLIQPALRTAWIIGAVYMILMQEGLEYDNDVIKALADIIDVGLEKLCT